MDCKLLFRTPTDDPASNASFYEDKYAQGFTTEMPSDLTLEHLIATNFAGTEKDYAYYIGILLQLGLQEDARVFDYGCSWGYGSYQLGRAGFQVTSFEVAPSRRRFAREKLNVETIDDMQNVRGHFDCFFSAHVLEHVPSPRLTFQYAMTLLKPGGLFVSFTPNGSKAHRVSPGWSRLWGEVHPNFIDDVFLDEAFALAPRAFGASPVNPSLPEDASPKRLNSLEGSELFFAARKIGTAWS